MLIREEMKKKIAFIGVLLLLLVVGAVVIFVNKSGLSEADIKVPDYYALDEFYIDAGQKEFRRDTYNWYKSIENKEGVYLINSAYYGEDVLNAWKENNVYHTIPNEAFWYFAASPSYLKEINIDLSESELSDAENGVRLYLIPDTLSDSEAAIMSEYLKEDALKDLEKSDIQTAFVKNKEIRIIKYTPKDKYFSWVNDLAQEPTATPVIYVCTAENMKYFESESLTATGVDSYIKFKDEEAIEKLTNKKLVNKYNLNYSRSSKIYKKAEKNKLVDKGVHKIFK